MVELRKEETIVIRIKYYEDVVLKHLMNEALLSVVGPESIKANHGANFRQELAANLVHGRD